MTMPTEPTLDVSAVEPTPAPAPASAPAPQEGAAAEPQKPAEDITALPEWAQKAIRDARAEAAKTRTTAKQTAAEEARTELTQQIARALGLAEDDKVDPAALTEQISQAQNDAWRAGVELNVYRLAGRLGADADKLLDSIAFVDSLDDLVDADPRSPDFTTQLEAKVQAALERNPLYRAASQAQAASTTPPASNAPRPDPSQGARGPGAATRPTSIFDAVAAHLAQQR
jgi:hypothetical protein